MCCSPIGLDYTIFNILFNTGGKLRVKKIVTHSIAVNKQDVSVFKFVFVIYAGSQWVVTCRTDLVWKVK
jgi:hypothetical protein